MKILCLQDAHKQSGLSKDFVSRLGQSTRAAGHELEVVDLARGELAYCMGCLRCWYSESGKCVSRDKLSRLEDRLPEFDLLLFLTPVLFGSFSAEIKTPIEKGFGCKLALGRLYPQLVVGYGEDLDEEEMDCFLDLTRKHRGAADVVHPELSGVRVEALVTRSREDNAALLRRIERVYLSGGGEKP
jgi:multimeric flavodoxin WrbA